MGTVLRSLTIMAISAIAGFTIFLLLTASPLLGDMSVLFYREAVLCGFAAIILAILLAVLTRRIMNADMATIIASVTTSLSINLVFLVLLPVTIDRSISVFLLSQIESHDARPLDEADLTSVFVGRYVHDMRQIDRRIAEQRLSGNITINRGVVRITPQGHRFLSFSRAIAKLFGTDRRFVDPAPTPQRSADSGHG